MNLQEENALVEKAKTSADAFSSLYEQNYPRIFNYVLRRTGNLEAAQDITSNVFFKSLKSLHRYRFKGAPFSAWLYSIASHEIANYYNQNKHDKELAREVKAFGDVSQDSIEEELEKADHEMREQHDLIEMQKLLLRLSPNYQEIISLRYFEGKSLHEMSEILGKKEGAIKSLLHRGIEKMRKEMGHGETI